MRRVAVLLVSVGLLFVGCLGYLAGSSHLLTPSSLAAADDCQTFPETGKTVCGDFLAYWNSHGGLAQQGYPVSDVFDEKSETDGITHKVQYFERAVFEEHPENSPPNNVLLSLLGSQKYKAKYQSGAPVAAAPPPVPVAPSPTAIPSSAPPTAAVTTTIVDITSPIARSAQASVTVQTAPGASCTISVKYQSGQINVQGLEPKTANGTGIASWVWKIGADTLPGTWPVTVACIVNDQYTTSSKTIVVT